jgi:CheY-like chemotaxis protein
VLVVEDDDELRESVCVLLERRGFRVASAAHGREALDWIEENGVPRLVLLDLMMPVMDGWRFRRELLTNPELNSIPVVVISGVADAYDHAKTLEAVDCLIKPISPKKLYDIVNHSIDKKSE